MVTIYICKTISNTFNSNGIYQLVVQMKHLIANTKYTGVMDKGTVVGGECTWVEDLWYYQNINIYWCQFLILMILVKCTSTTKK